MFCLQDSKEHIVLFFFCSETLPQCSFQLFLNSGIPQVSQKTSNLLGLGISQPVPSDGLLPVFLASHSSYKRVFVCHKQVAINSHERSHETNISLSVQCTIWQQLN